MNRLRTLARTRRFAAALIVALTLLGAGVGWAVELARGPLYEVRTQVQVRFWGLETYLLTGQASQVSAVDVADAATLASSRTVLAAVAEELGDGWDALDVADSVTVAPETSTNTVSITATAPDAESALLISETVATQLIDTVDERLRSTAGSLQDSVGEDVATVVAQRAQALTSSVEPLDALGPGQVEQLAPASATPLALSIVGLAAGTLMVVLVHASRPGIGGPRAVQRMLDVPAVSFGRPEGDAAAGRLVQQLVEDRPTGRLLVVPATATAEKAAARFVDWARNRAATSAAARRLVAASDPASAVLRRVTGGEVAAVVLVAERGAPRRDVLDAAALLRSWHPVDAVVVTTP